MTISDSVEMDGISRCDETATVDGNVIVEASDILDNAHVYGNAKLSGASVKGNAHVCGNTIFTSSRAEDDARVYGNTKLVGVAVLENAQVYENADLVSIIIEGNSRVFGNAKLESKSSSLIIALKGSCKFGGTASFDGLDTYDDFVNKYGEENVQERFRGLNLIDVWDMG